MQPIHFLLNVVKKIKKKGSNHFTLMFVPLSGRRILSFRISNYTVLIVFLLMGFALLSLYRYWITKQELLTHLNEVKAKDKIYWQTYKIISKNIKKSQEEMTSLEKKLSDIYKIIADKNHFDWMTPSIDGGKIKKKYGLNHPIPPIVSEIEELKYSLSVVEGKFKEIQKLLEMRREIMDHLPTRWPLFGDDGYRTSGFGKRFSPFEGKYKFHAGLDIASFPGTPVVAAADGVVSFSGIKDGYGNTLVIDHKYGYKTLYGHNARILVRVNQKVKKGQKIAVLGRSGRTTGYHVHFEIRINNIPIDPWPFITVEI